MGLECAHRSKTHTAGCGDCPAKPRASNGVGRRDGTGNGWAAEQKGREMTNEQLVALEARIEAEYRAEQIERMKDAIRAVEQASTQRYRTSSVWGVVPQSK